MIVKFTILTNRWMDDILDFSADGYFLIKIYCSQQPLNSLEFWDSIGFPRVCTPTRTLPSTKMISAHDVRQNDWTSCYQFHKFRKESPRGTRAAMNFIADYEDIYTYIIFTFFWIQ